MAADPFYLVCPRDVITLTPITPTDPIADQVDATSGMGSAGTAMNTNTTGRNQQKYDVGTNLSEATFVFTASLARAGKEADPISRQDDRRKTVACSNPDHTNQAQILQETRAIDLDEPNGHVMAGQNTVLQQLRNCTNIEGE